MSTHRKDTSKLEYRLLMVYPKVLHTARVIYLRILDALPFSGLFTEPLVQVLNCLLCGCIACSHIDVYVTLGLLSPLSVGQTVVVCKRYFRV